MIEIWQDFIFKRQERMKGTAECKRNRLEVKEIQKEDGIKLEIKS